MSTENKKREENKAQDSKRKRVNQLKTLIVVFVVVLLFTSVALNFTMVLKVLHLDGKISKLYSIEPRVVVENTILL